MDGAEPFHSTHAPFNGRRRTDARQQKRLHGQELAPFLMTADLEHHVAILERFDERQMTPFKPCQRFQRGEGTKLLSIL